jgi:hypothetical protein
MDLFPAKVPAGYPNVLQWESSFLWLEIEQLVFISILISNVVFLMIRSLVKHKLHLDQIDERR